MLFKKLMPQLNMGAKLKILRGDITQQNVDAIVNAANNRLLGGGGVDGAIHRAAGPELLTECRSIGGCPTGEARITKGYNLTARYIIHTVGPVWDDGENGESELLKRAYLSSLRLATEYKVKKMAFPCISTGVYGYPLAEAASIAIETVEAYIKNNKYPKEILFVIFDDENYQAYSKILGLH